MNDKLTTNQKKSKVKINKGFSKIHMSVFAAIFAVIGILALVSSFAAPATPLTLDSSLPQPIEVEAFGDNQSITVKWRGVNDSRVVGYYITYRVAGSNDEYSVRQQEAEKTQWGEQTNAIQLQPLQNGVEYEINIQSASGYYENHPGGPLVSSSGNENGSNWARADGKVSEKVNVSATTTSARVDAMRAKYTGFFDDFNQIAGPFDELKWNQTGNGCLAPGRAAAFINGQFHSHNTVKSDGQCDRAGIATRPRAVFDMTGASEQNPAELGIDVDGITHGRDTWYLDFIPTSSRTNDLPLDITSHNDIDDNDTFGPGNMIRINARGGGLSAVYYDANQNPIRMNLHVEDTACGTDYRGDDWANYTSCNWDEKTPGLSPIPEASFSSGSISNVRRNWVVRFTDTKMRVYQDSVHIASANLPANFVAEKQYTVHSTVFSYNTGKETRGNGVIPSVQMIHWDNFGFTGPASDEVVHNYLEGQASGDDPAYGTGTVEAEIPKGNRTTIIPVPDPIGNIKDDQAGLFFTVQQRGFYYYHWSSDDHVLFNGTRYDVPSPRQLSGFTPHNNQVEAWFAFSMKINKEDIVQGDNTVEFVMDGNPNANNSREADVIQVHVELPYDASDPNIPNYSQPLDIFGDKFRVVAEPAITNCDFYRLVEKDLGLPYQSGQENITAGVCELLSAAASQHNVGGGGGDPDPEPSDADINGDNEVNILDLSIMLSNWGTSSASADINGDGTVNILDLSGLLGQWGK